MALPDPLVPVVVWVVESVVPPLLRPGVVPTATSQYIVPDISVKPPDVNMVRLLVPAGGIVPPASEWSNWTPEPRRIGLHK